MAQTYDPRAQITHDIEEEQIYEDSRTNDELVLIFASDDVVLLRDEESGSHRLEPRDTFEAYVGSDRYTLTDKRAQDSKGAIRELLEHYSAQDGRKAKHKVEAIEEVLEILEEDLAPDAREEIDYTSISGVGTKTAENLQRAGYALKKDVRDASDEDLLEVDGVGQGNLEHIRTFVRRG